jgi:hypothetical protein
MTERLSDAMAQMLDEGEPRSDDAALRALLYARLAGSLSEGLAHDAGRNGRASGDDSALIAAFLDGAATPAEREAIAARLAADPAARADLVSAMALLDDIAAQPEALPAGLAARAEEIFAADPAPAMQAGGGWLQSLVSASRWRSAPGPRFALAAVLAVAIATPALLQMGWHGDAGMQRQDQDSGPVGRGLAPAETMRKAPAATAKGAQGCEPSETPAVAAAAPADRRTPPPPAAKPTVNGAAVTSPTAQNDPCGRKAPAQNIPAGRRN